jgi:hypothetical protein
MSQPDAPDTSEPREEALDGNAAAGYLREIFAVELTAAVGRCAGCGRTGALGGARCYGPAPGIVLRCVGCDGVLLRLVTTTDRAWLDLRGLVALQLALPTDDTLPT